MDSILTTIILGSPRFADATELAILTCRNDIGSLKHTGMVTLVKSFPITVFKKLKRFLIDDFSLVFGSNSRLTFGFLKA